MLKCKALILCLGLLLFSVCSGWCAGLEFGIEAKGWFTEVEGDVKITDAGLTGTKVDFVSDLGLDDTADIPEGEVWIRFGRNKFLVSYFQIEHEGSKVVTKDITYNGYTYTINQRIDSEFDIKHGELSYVRTLFGSDMGELGLLVGVKYIGFEGMLKGVGGVADGVTQSEDLNVPVPVLGVNGRVSITPWLALKGSIKGIDVDDVEEVNATLVDAQGVVEVILTKNFSIAAGYRYIDLEGSHKNDEASYTLEGPSVAGLVTF